MKQFGVGRHATSGGHLAIVTKLTMRRGEWILKGVIRCPQTHALRTAVWTVSGVSIELQHPDFNLAEELSA